MGRQRDGEDPRVGWVVPSDASETGGGDATSAWLWGMTPRERLRRSLVRAGCEAVCTTASPPSAVADAVVLAVRDGFVLDERLLLALSERPNTVLVHPAHGPLAVCAPGTRVGAIRPHLCETADDASEDAASSEAWHERTPDALVPAYQPKLRKRAEPFVFPAEPEHRAAIEADTFAASYKGSSDLVTLWVWPRPARAVTHWCAERGVQPNTVTLWSWVGAIVAFWLLWNGHFVAGLLVGWWMTFLDTVDGKLARVTLTSSRLGDVLDHGLDLVHPPFWWWAFGIGLGTGHEAATAIIVGGYVLGRVLEGAFLASFGFECHSWRPADALFRTITARRNPNLLLLSVGTAVGRPDLGFTLVAAWTLCSLAFHSVRLLQAFVARRDGTPVVAWAAG
ncbi:MAG: CDP-alcohol phosphatidyltransferase family protein [Myxococcota bacterium]